MVILALAAAAVAVTRLRRQQGLAAWSVVLFALLIIQSALGAAIRGTRGLILIHVPLALLVMGLGVFLSASGTRAPRSSPRT